jgi:hypothetical protein
MERICDQHGANSSPFAGPSTGRLDYEYYPLQDAASIRLIELQPGVGDSPLQIGIHSSSLPSKQNYEALSYTWGESSQTCDLLCSNGSKLQITFNLQLALRNLRLPGKSRWLWVDAICINQKDNAEKSHQVSMMRQIYQASEETIVYLGEADAHSDELLKFAEARANAFIRRLKLTKEDEADEVDTDKICYFIMSKSQLKEVPKNTREHATIVPEFIKLVSRPWFTRIWIIQEFAVSKRIVFRCGTATCTWYSLYFLYVEFIMLFKDLTRFVTSENEESHDFVFGRSGFINMLELRAKYLQLEPLDLQDLIHTFSLGQASLGHDKIYALLGLIREHERQFSNHAAMQLQPDYDLNLAKVYIQYATAFVGMGRGELGKSVMSSTLDLLHDASCYTEKIAGLPSWVPDWSIERFRISLGNVGKNTPPFETERYYDASGWQRWKTERDFKQAPLLASHPECEAFPEAYPNVTEDILSVRGVITDEIGFLLQVPPIRESLIRDLPPFFVAVNLLVSTRARNPYHTGEDMMTVAWKTLVGNRDGIGRSPPEEWSNSYVAAPQVLQRLSNSRMFIRNGSPGYWDEAWGDEKQFMDGWSADPTENLTYVLSTHPDPQTYLYWVADAKLYLQHIDFFTSIKLMAGGRALCVTSQGFIGSVLATNTGIRILFANTIRE